MPEQKLIDALWPDDDGDFARNALTIAIHPAAQAPRSPRVDRRRGRQGRVRPQTMLARPMVVRSPDVVRLPSGPVKMSRAANASLRSIAAIFSPATRSWRGRCHAASRCGRASPGWSRPTRATRAADASVIFQRGIEGRAAGGGTVSRLDAAPSPARPRGRRAGSSTRAFGELHDDGSEMGPMPDTETLLGRLRADAR